MVHLDHVSFLRDFVSLKRCQSLASAVLLRCLRGDMGSILQMVFHAHGDHAALVHVCCNVCGLLQTCETLKDLAALGRHE